MIRRGLTILETLLALGLLAMLSVASVSWAVDTQRLAQDLGRNSRWESAANAALDRLAEDLARHDVLDDNTGRLEIEEGVLRFATRHNGPAVVEYALSREGALTRQVHPTAARLLISEIGSLDTTLVFPDDDATDDDSPVGFVITLVSMSGDVIQRSVSLNGRGVSP